MDGKLKSCDFCGRAVAEVRVNHYRQEAFVECQNCGARMPGGLFGKNSVGDDLGTMDAAIAKAVEKWNARQSKVAPHGNPERR